MRYSHQDRNIAVFIVTSLLIALIALTFVIPMGSSAQDAPTPTSFFSFDLNPTLTPSGFDMTVPPSLTGVNGRADRGAVAIRSGPGLEYPRVGSLRSGGLIDIIGYNGYPLSRPCSANFAADLDMWVQVQSGWMARCALTMTGEFNMVQMLNNAPPPGANPPRGLRTPAPSLPTFTPYALFTITAPPPATSTPRP